MVVRSFYLRNRKIIKASVVFSLSVVISLFFFYILISCVRIISESNENEVEDSVISEYQYLKFNPRTNASSKGMKTLQNTELEIDEYISYKDEKGNFNLISNFGAQEYRCYGTCVCEERLQHDTKRRSTTTSSLKFTKSIIYLVAAVSSFMAYKKADEYFEKECEGIDSSYVCSQKSPPEKFCEDFYSAYEDYVDEDEVEEEFPPPDDGVEDPKVDFRKYWCRGKCERVIMTGYNDEMSKNAGCHEYRKSGEVVFDAQGVALPGQRAKAEFSARHLREHCREEGKAEFFPSFDLQETIVTYFCTSTRTNPTIQCVQTYPRVKRNVVSVDDL